jgi:acyl transferase domain-containing protein
MAVEDSAEGIAPASYAAEKSKPEYNGLEDSPASAGVMPIAICGMACRLPGDIFSPQDLWEFLIAGRDARSPIPPSRFNISGFYSSPAESTQQDGMSPAQLPPKPSTINTWHGYFLSDKVDLGAVDASFFSMTRGELERCDPHQKQMLEVARECIEDAGEVGGVAGVRGREVGCYMGSFGDDWVEMFGRDPLPYGLYRVSGYGDFALSNRISYEMDLKGPKFVSA